LNKKKLVIGIAGLLIILLIAVALIPSIDEEDMDPAEFEVKNLSVSPSEVEIGELVIVSVEIHNIGEGSGTHTVWLSVSGEREYSSTVELEGGESHTLHWDFKREEPGEYLVSVGDLQDNFEVKEDIPT